MSIHTAGQVRLQPNARARRQCIRPGTHSQPAVLGRACKGSRSRLAVNAEAAGWCHPGHAKVAGRDRPAHKRQRVQIGQRTQGQRAGPMPRTRRQPEGFGRPRKRSRSRSASTTGLRRTHDLARSCVGANAPRLRAPRCTSGSCTIPSLSPPDTLQNLNDALEIHNKRAPRRERLGRAPRNAQLYLLLLPCYSRKKVHLLPYGVYEATVV